jgi:hypothetical protein
MAVAGFLVNRTDLYREELAAFSASLDARPNEQMCAGAFEVGGASPSALTATAKRVVTRKMHRVSSSNSSSRISPLSSSASKPRESA